MARVHASLLAALIACTGRAPAPDAEAGRPCGECHEREHAEWATSRHAVAATNPIFEAALRHSPYAGWCLSCHAPTGDQGAGVDCITCHLRDGVVLTARSAGEWAHPIRVEPALSEAEACAPCHQFTLPYDHPMASEVPVQATLDEWRELSPDRPCQGCHMGERGHAFPGSHDLEMLKRAVDVEVSREGGRVRAEIRAVDPGHRVPTGDAFRRLVWELCADPACAVRVARGSAAVVHGAPWQVLADTRLGADPLVVDRPDPGGALWWRLVFRYADPEHEAVLPREEVEVEVAAGTL